VSNGCEIAHIVAKSISSSIGLATNRLGGGIDMIGNYSGTYEAGSARPTTASGAAAGASGMHETMLLAVARQQRAEYLRTMGAGMLQFLKRPRVMFVAIVVAVASAALVVGYATLLSRIGVPASAVALFAVLLASTLSSIAGFAFSAICGVMLLQLINDPVQVVEIMMVCSIAIQSLSVAVLWRDIAWRDVLTFVVGGAFGLPIGVGLLLHLGQFGFKEAIGGLLTCYAAYVLFQRPLSIKSCGNVADVCAGFLGGITGGLAGFPGAAVTIWCGMKGWDKRRQRGVYQPFILVMQILALMLIHFMRATTARSYSLDLELVQYVPAALLGTWFGLSIFGRMSDRAFALTVNVLLLVSGVGLLI
jgi:uncharacterized protein